MSRKREVCKDSRLIKRQETGCLDLRMCVQMVIAKGCRLWVGAGEEVNIGCNDKCTTLGTHQESLNVYVCWFVCFILWNSVSQTPGWPRTHSVPEPDISSWSSCLSSEPWGYKHVPPHPVCSARTELWACACSVSILPTELGPSPEYAL